MDKQDVHIDNEVTQDIDIEVIQEMEQLIMLAKQGRKKLKREEIYKVINAREIWDLMKSYSLLKRTKEVPIDIVRMIMLYLDAREYREMCLPLNKRFYYWVQQDTRRIELRIDTTRFTKNGCSGTCYRYYECIYPNNFPVNIKIGNENATIKRKMCHHNEFTRSYQANFTVNISTPDGTTIKVFEDNVYDWTCSSKTKIVKSEGLDLKTYWVDTKGNIFDKNDAPKSSYFKYAILTFYK